MAATDGRACKKAGVGPKTKEYRGKDPLAFVISMNPQRRELNESHPEMVAAKIATLRKREEGSIRCRNCGICSNGARVEASRRQRGFDKIVDSPKPAQTATKVTTWQGWVEEAPKRSALAVRR